MLPSPPFHGVRLWGRHKPPALGSILSLLCSRAARSALCSPRKGWQRFSRPRRCRGSHKPSQQDSHSPPTPAPSPSSSRTCSQHHPDHAATSITGPSRVHRELPAPGPAPHLPAANLPATPPHHQRGKGTGKHWEPALVLSRLIHQSAAGSLHGAGLPEAARSARDELR